MGEGAIRTSIILVQRMYPAGLITPGENSQCPIGPARAVDQTLSGPIAPLVDASFAQIVVRQLVKDKPTEPINNHSAQLIGPGFGGPSDSEPCLLLLLFNPVNMAHQESVRKPNKRQQIKFTG